LTQTYPARGLHGRVVQDIGLRIVSGRVRPGDALPNETMLSEELAVSRTVVREAIKVLVSKGLVEVRPKTGTRIRPRRYWHLLDPDVLGWQFEQLAAAEDLRELQEVRATVAPAAARLAALRHTDDEMAALEAHLRRMESALGEVEAFGRADLDFQSAVFEASHNNLLMHVNAMVRVALEAGAARHLAASDRDDKTMALRRAVLDAVRNRQPEEAEAAMRAVTDGAWAVVPSGDAHPEGSRP
jgi:GntR family galactonate operon transcriptional repressor